MRLALLLVLVVTALGCSGKEARDISVEPLAKAGTSVRLADLKGKVVLIDFWATWCGPCKINMPEVQALHEKHAKNGLEILAISDEDRETVSSFIKESGVTYPIYLDPSGKAFMTYNVKSIPHAVLVGRDGSLLYEGHPGEPELATKLEQAVASK